MLHLEAVGDPSEALLQWFSILQVRAQGALSSFLPSVCPYVGLAPAAGRFEIFPSLLVVEVQKSRLFGTPTVKYLPNLTLFTQPRKAQLTVRA